MLLVEARLATVLNESADLMEIWFRMYKHGIEYGMYKKHPAPNPFRRFGLIRETSGAGGVNLTSQGWELCCWLSTRKSN